MPGNQPRQGQGGRRPPEGPRGPRQGQGGRPPAPQADTEQLDRLLESAREVRYFADEERKRMRPELVDGEAIEVAKAWAELNSSQLRRFFSEVMALRRQVDLDPKLPDDHIRARLALLKARAAYTYGRDKNRIPPRLVEFFRDHALSVKDKTDFQAFNRHFESVVAFHKFYAKSKN